MALASAPARTSPAPGVEHSVGFLRGAAGDLFYSVHAPDGGAQASLVLCPPLLADHPFSYRRELLLAVELARHGVATWRFHYAGTGYSEGAAEAMSFESLVRDASAVIGTAESASDAPVTVGGTRCGALVAAVAAADRPLVFWEPVVDGAGYIREGFRARMIADGGQLKRTPPTAEELLLQLRSSGRVDLLGYALHARLHDSIAGRKLRDLVTARGRMLVIDSGGGDQDMWGVGREVTTVFAGRREAWWFHRTQQSDPSVMAAELSRAIGGWLSRADGAESVALPPARGGAECAFIETAGTSVFALLTPPATPPRGVTLVLLWGGGGMPAFGRNQVATTLARALAGRGYHVLQLDYPGRGDSSGSEPPDPIDEPAKQQLFAAATDAYRWLHRRGLSRVVAVGSCQGAVAALNTIDVPDDLAGIALLGPPLGERFENDGRDGGTCGSAAAMHPRMRTSFQRLVASGRPVLIAFGVHDEGYESFQGAMDGELGATLQPLGDRLTLTLTEERIHGYMTVSGQETTIDIVTRWLDQLAT